MLRNRRNDRNKLKLPFSKLKLDSNSPHSMLIYNKNEEKYITFKRNGNLKNTSSL